MSSISQMERSSSQTRMLATRPPSGCGQRGLEGRGAARGRCHRRGALGVEAAKPQNKRRSLPFLGPRPYLAFVSLHDLVDDGEAKAGAALKVRLERLEDFFHLLRAHSGTGIGESDLPVVADRLDRDGQSSATPHGANRVFTNIPENLLELVAVGDGRGFLH